MRSDLEYMDVRSPSQTVVLQGFGMVNIVTRALAWATANRESTHNGEGVRNAERTHDVVIVY